MKTKLENFLPQIILFLGLGIAIALIIALLIILYYAVLWGLIIGTVLWIINLISNYFTKRHAPAKNTGRIIEHDNKE